jgi:ribose-phosphate pyrophosphokinase
MKPTVFPLPGNEALAARVAGEIGGRRGRLEARRFPDGEAYVRIVSPVAGRPVVLAATLDRPDEKLLPLLLAASTVRELGASTVGLVAPYLPYLRQDSRFRGGEAVSARHFAGLLSNAFDWLVTVDPHLHRLHALSDVYTIPTESVCAAPRLAEWVRRHVLAPLVIGPDIESRQWIEDVAAAAGVPSVVFRKQRMGDALVIEDLPDLTPYRDRIPVLVDDIISTGATMIQAARALEGLGFPPPHCVAVHAIFSSGAYARLQAAGVASVVTCNTVEHPSNVIDIHDLLAAATSRQVDEATAKPESRPW